MLNHIGTLEPEAYLEREAHDDPADCERVLLSQLDADSLRAVVQRDDQGHWLGIWVGYPPTEPAVSEGKILETTRSFFEHLYPAYDLLAWYPRKP